MWVRWDGSDCSGINLDVVLERRHISSRRVVVIHSLAIARHSQPFFFSRSKTALPCSDHPL